MPIWYMGYYNEHYSNGATQITDFDKYIEHQVYYYSVRFRSNIYSWVTMAALALDTFLIWLSGIIYITPAGCVNRTMKKSGEVTGSVIQGRIRLYLKEALDSTTQIAGFKFNAENMALLGRFIESEAKSEDKAEDRLGDNIDEADDNKAENEGEEL